MEKRVFGRVQDAVQCGDLTEIQRKAYDAFLQPRSLPRIAVSIQSIMRIVSDQPGHEVSRAGGPATAGSSWIAELTFRGLSAPATIIARNLPLEIRSEEIPPS